MEQPIVQLASRKSKKSHSPSLEGFLDWVERGGTEIKRDMERGRNEVRVMTVHGAKGLQAPIVYLPDTTRVPRFNDRLLTSPEDDGRLWLPRADDANIAADAAHR